MRGAGVRGGEVLLIDEALTPDSSRIWDERDYRTGISPPSFDKQILRDWLETLDWDKEYPAPDLDPDPSPAQDPAQDPAWTEPPSGAS